MEEFSVGRAVKRIQVRRFFTPTEVRYMRRFLFAAACWATVGLVGARADVSYRYITDQASYTGAAGTIVPVKLILQETVTGTSTSKVFADGGIFGAGVILNSPGGAIYGGFDS